MSSFRNNRAYSNKCFSAHEIKRLIIMKMKMKIKTRSNRYDITSPRTYHEHIYSKYKKCHSIVMLVCIKQYPKHHLKLYS